MYRECFVRRAALVCLALLTAALPFAAPQPCAAALRDGLALCGGPLLLSLFPFLIVSSLLVRCGATEALGVVLRPAARAMGFGAGCSGGVLLIGLLGGFAPAANAAAEAYRAGELSREEAAALLPACVCSGPSFVILTVGAGMLGSMELGVRLFLAQVLAGYVSAGVLRRAARRRAQKRGGGQWDVPAAAAAPRPAVPGPSAIPASAPRPAVSDVPGTAPRPAAQPPQLYRVIADAAMTYLRLCGFVLYFRLLAGGLAALLPAGAGVWPAMLLEVCSGCDLAARAGRWGSMLCCAALSWQGASVLMQVRAICPREISLAPLLAARALHLPLSLLLFRVLLPQGAAEAFSTLCARVVTMQRVPTDCALLVFFGCCLAACGCCRAVQGRGGADWDAS